MGSLPLIILCLFASYTVSRGPSRSLRATCTQKKERKAWHTLNDNEKNAYLSAEKCLMDVPAPRNTQLPVARTIFQALQEQHQLQSEYIHEVGGFLPYHRYMTWAHEHLLRAECNYTGAQPWWDEERDASHFVNSSVFNSISGFGGRSPGCVTDGPFAAYSLIIGPGYNNTEHCLSREIDDLSSQASSAKWLKFCEDASTFEEAWDRIEFYPHSAGHSGVGGEMLNPISSPGDPLFYLHHAFVDKIWWDWQSADLGARLYSIGGPNVRDSERPAPIPDDLPETLHERANNGTGKERIHYLGDNGNVTTLSHKLSLLGLLPEITAADVMDIGNELLCYEYA